MAYDDAADGCVLLLPSLKAILMGASAFRLDVADHATSNPISAMHNLAICHNEIHRALS